MDIRTRLTFQFVGLISLLLALALSVIYYSSEVYREDEFYHRLKNKGSNVAQLLLEVDEISPELLRKIDLKNPINLPEEEIRIYDESKKIIFEKDITNSRHFDTGVLSELNRVNVVMKYEDKSQLLAFKKNNKGKVHFIITKGLDVYGYSKLANLRTTMIITFGCAVIFLWFLGRIFVARAFKPVINMVKQVKEMNIQDLRKRLEIDNQFDEIGQLGNTFNELLTRIEKVFMTQKNFISNASHELRTPLTAITGQLEVELLQKRTADEYRKTIESTLEDMKSLNEISNKLLVLAQASSENPDNQFTPLRIDEIIWQARQEISKRYLDSKISFEMNSDIEEEAELTVIGNEQLLKICFLNLLDNGCKYSVDRSVKIKLLSDGDTCTIIFSDKGIGIKNEDIKHIFEPFYRSKSVLHTKGHGIGLSLVEKIISLHSGTISVKSSDIGTEFEITLPVYRNFIVV